MYVLPDFSPYVWDPVYITLLLKSELGQLNAAFIVCFGTNACNLKKAEYVKQSWWERVLQSKWNILLLPLRFSYDGYKFFRSAFLPLWIETQVRGLKLLDWVSRLFLTLQSACMLTAVTGYLDFIFVSVLSVHLSLCPVSRYFSCKKQTPLKQQMV